MENNPINETPQTKASDGFFSASNRENAQTKIGDISSENEPQEIQKQVTAAPPPNSKFKPIIFAIITGIILVAVIGTAYKMFKSTAKPETSTTTETATNSKTLSAYVSYLSGTAWRYVDDRRVEIKESDTLVEGDEVMTDENTQMVLMFDEGSIVRLDEKTLVVLEEIKSSAIKVREENGNIFSRVNKDEDHKFIVTAAGITVESLGTAFSVANEEEVSVKVFESKVKVKETFGPETEVNENEKWDTKTKEVAVLEEEVEENSFLAVSLEEAGLKTESVEKKAEEKKAETEKVEEENTPPPASGASINLSAKKLDDGIFITWSTSGIDTSKGFKIVKSYDANPSFPKNGYIYVSDSSVRNYKLHLKDGKTWNIRICQYLGDGTCGEYSNNVAIQAPQVEDSSSSEGSGEVSKIKLSISESSDTTVKLKWEVDGHSEKGFKVVWSKNSSPEYPTRDGDKFHYLSKSGARSDTVKGLEDGKKYYFRVCEYLGGKCGKYSNEVSVKL
jgi:hypothetical protein